MEGENSHRRHIPQHKVSNKENLNILYYNARSLVPKLDELALLIETHNPDIVCIVETWLSDDILDSEISFPGSMYIVLIVIDMVEELHCI